MYKVGDVLKFQHGNTLWVLALVEYDPYRKIGLICINPESHDFGWSWSNRTITVNNSFRITKEDISLLIKDDWENWTIITHGGERISKQLSIFGE